MALEALVDTFGWQTENREELLASCMDAESATRAQGLSKFQEFQEIWIGEIESISETLDRLI